MFLVVAAFSVRAVDFTYSASISNGIADSFENEFGNPTFIDLFIEIGTYELSVFTPFAGEAIPVNFGIFSNTIEGFDTTVNGLDIEGDQLAIRIFNASTISTATEFGIFYMDKEVNTEWSVKSGDASGGILNPDSQNIIDLGDLTGRGSSLITGSNIINGDFGTASGTFGNPNFLTGPGIVPEPSTYALFAGLLALGFIVIRRSRSRV